MGYFVTFVVHPQLTVSAAGYHNHSRSGRLVFCRKVKSYRGMVNAGYDMLAILVDAHLFFPRLAFRTRGAVGPEKNSLVLCKCRTDKRYEYENGLTDSGPKQFGGSYFHLVSEDGDSD